MLYLLICLTTEYIHLGVVQLFPLVLYEKSSFRFARQSNYGEDTNANTATTVKAMELRTVIMVFSNSVYEEFVSSN